METTKYVSRHTGEEIDSLLDKVKEDLVSPATLTNKVEANAAELDKKVSKEDINTGTFNPTSDNPAGQKSIAGAMEKQNQSLQNQVSEEATKRETADTVLQTNIDKKQNRITFTAGSGISIETSDDGTVKIACSYSDGDMEAY